MHFKNNMKKFTIYILHFIIFAFTLYIVHCTSYIAFAQSGIPGACGSNGKNPLPLDGSTFLGPTYNQSTCGLNYVQASVLVETRSAAAGFNATGTGLPTTLP